MRRGYAGRNRGHNLRQSERAAIAALGGEPGLAAAYDRFRAACAKLARRRVPRGAAPGDNRAAAGVAVDLATDALTRLAEAIDAGDYDTTAPAKGDDSR